MMELDQEPSAVITYEMFLEAKRLLERPPEPPKYLVPAGALYFAATDHGQQTDKP